MTSFVRVLNTGAVIVDLAGWLRTPAGLAQLAAISRLRDRLRDATKGI